MKFTVILTPTTSSYDAAVQDPAELEEDEYFPRPANQSSLIVLTPPATLSTDTLVDPGRMRSSLNTPSYNSDLQRNRNDLPEVRGPFTFSPFGTNTMLLLPHPLSPNSRPLYHISVSNDFFRPHIYITTIRRGGSDQGEIVAEIKSSLPHFNRRASADVTHL
jgi:hypothetical protein